MTLGGIPLHGNRGNSTTGFTRHDEYMYEFNPKGYDTIIYGRIPYFPGPGLSDSLPHLIIAVELQHEEYIQVSA
jgi:hypothetical protein